MNRPLLTGLLVVGLAGIGPLAPAPASASAAAVRPAATKLVNTVLIDVDGDGRKDTVRVYKLSRTRWKVKVVTAKHKTITRVFTSTFPSDWGYRTPWYGAGELDGVRGYELVFHLWGQDGTGRVAYTWRKGKLVVAKTPEGKAQWYYGGPLPDYMGYSFTVVDGIHHVTAYSEEYLSETQVQLTQTDYAWQSGKWKKLKKSQKVVTDAEVGPLVADTITWVR